MSRRNYESLELMKRKISMAQSIAAKDHDYGLYAGAALEDAQTMALIDWAIAHNVFSADTVELMTTFRSFLNYQRKAFLATISSEVTKLGFILGYPYAPKSALKR